LTREDILKLLEIKMMRITKFDTDKANDTLMAIQKKIEEIDHHLANIVDFTIAWYLGLKAKYGKDHPRLTEIRNFETIVAAKVVEANEKLYVNHEEGFIGTALKKDEFVSNCSDIDDIIIFFKDGRYKIVKVVDKMFVGKNILHLDVFKKNDKRTVYNAVYRDGKLGPYYIKRFAVNGITRDKEYDITQGTAGSKVVYFTVNPNAEAEVIRVTLKPKLRLNKLVFEKDFCEIAIKGRQSMGNILTKNDIHKIALKQKGGSTLGGRQVWFDRDVLRLNYDSRGEYLGEFQSDQSILVVSSKGEYYTTNFDLANHYNKDIMVIEKFDPHKVWSVVLYDAEQKFNYLKRFQLEPSQKPLNFLGESADSRLLLMSDVDFPRFEVIFGGNDAYRETLVLDAEEFIGVKSYKAKGKRLTTFEVETINELEPLRFNVPVSTPGHEGGSGEDDNSNGGENNEGSDDTELNGPTGIEEEYEDIVDPEISVKSVEHESFGSEIIELKPIKPKKDKPVKPVKKVSDSTDEIIDNSKIIDDITGQLNLFD